MWHWTAPWIVAVGAATSVAENASFLPPSLQRSRILSEQPHLRFRVVAGRLSLQHVQLGTRLQRTFERVDGDRKEQLTLLSGDFNLVVRFVMESSQGAVHLDSDGPFRLSIVCVIETDDSVRRVAYHQKDESAVVLEIDDRGFRKTYRAPTVWHLCFQHPEAARKYLFPLCGIVGDRWQLEPTCRKVQSLLIERDPVVSVPDRRKVFQLVAKLGSSRRKVRREALYALRQLGSPILPVLDQVPAERLDREQRLQLHRLRLSLRRVDIDTPMGIAARLAGEPRVWQVLAQSDDLEVRAVAQRQLQRLSGEAPVVDFAATH